MLVRPLQRNTQQTQAKRAESVNDKVQNEIVGYKNSNYYKTQKKAEKEAERKSTQNADSTKQKQCRKRFAQNNAERSAKKVLNRQNARKKQMNKL